MIATGKGESDACGSVPGLDTACLRLVQTALDMVQYVAYARPPNTDDWDNIVAKLKTYGAGILSRIRAKMPGISGPYGFV